MENIAVHKTIISCNDFSDAFDSITKSKEIDVYYQVKKQDINANFIIWKENNEVRSKFQGNFSTSSIGTQQKLLFSSKSIQPM